MSCTGECSSLNLANCPGRSQCHSCRSLHKDIIELPQLHHNVLKVFFDSLPLPLPSLTEGDVPGDLLASVVSGMSVTLVTAVTTPVISVMSVRPVTPK